MEQAEPRVDREGHAPDRVGRGHVVEQQRHAWKPRMARSAASGLGAAPGCPPRTCGPDSRSGHLSSAPCARLPLVSGHRRDDTREAGQESTMRPGLRTEARGAFYA